MMDDKMQVLAVQYQAAVQMENWPIAERALREMIAQDSHNPATLFNLGLVLQRQRRPAEAIAALRNALMLASGHHNARYELAVALLDTGDLTAAHEEFARYVKAVPDDTAGLYHFGLVLLRKGDAEQARQILRRAHLEDQSDNVALALAEAERDCGMLDSAVTRLRATVSANPGAREAALAILSHSASNIQAADAAALLDNSD